MASPVVADPETCAFIRSIVERRGVAPVARLLNMAQGTTARIAGGLPVQPGTAELARQRVERLRRGEPR